VGGQPLWRLPAGDAAHLLPQRDRRLRVVTRPCGEFDADAVRFLLHLAGIGTHEGEVTNATDHALPEAGVDPEISADQCPADGCRNVQAGFLTGLFATVLTQCVRDLVPQHRRELVVGGPQLLDQAGIHRDLAAGHAPGVEFLGADNVDLPPPGGRIAAKSGSYRNQPLDDGPHPLELLRITIEQIPALRSAHGLVVGLGRRAIDRGRRNQHGLLAIDADATATGSPGRRASRRENRCQDRQRPLTKETRSHHAPHKRWAVSARGAGSGSPPASRSLARTPSATRTSPMTANAELSV